MSFVKKNPVKPQTTSNGSAADDDHNNQDDDDDALSSVGSIQMHQQQQAQAEVLDIDSKSSNLLIEFDAPPADATTSSNLIELGKEDALDDEDEEEQSTSRAKAAVMTAIKKTHNAATALRRQSELAPSSSSGIDELLRYVPMSKH